MAAAQDFFISSMQAFLHVNRLSEINNRQPTYLAIGSFDGVHKGHQAVLRQLVQAARRNGARSAVLTFFPHPKRVIQGITGRYYLNTLEERVQLIGKQGVDLIITHPFDEQVRQIRAADFVDQLLDTLDTRQIWGGNFAFGYNREGNISFLRKLGQQKGFSVKTIDAMIMWDNALISSSRIRTYLEAGDIQSVNGCLGRLHALSGRVTQGDQRGRTIGFPTANLEPWDELLLPGNGVYAAYAWLEDQRYIAATNVGVRPTVNGRQRTVEAHLLDFDEDLYGQTLRLEFMGRIRSEMKFDGLDALKKQIQSDVNGIRRQLT